MCAKETTATLPDRGQQPPPECDASNRQAVLQERHRLSCELHDSVAQLLYSLTLLAEAGKRMLAADDLSAAKRNQDRIERIAQQALQETRLIMYNLRNGQAEDVSLAEALDRRLEAVERRSGIEAQLLCADELDMAPQVAAEVLQIATEALNNSLKHSGAAAVSVRVENKSGRMTLSVRDSGRGFDLEKARQAGGMGLQTMSERAAALGASLDIISAPGEGTRVQLILPLTDKPDIPKPHSAASEELPT